MSNWYGVSKLSAAWYFEQLIQQSNINWPGSNYITSYSSMTHLIWMDDKIVNWAPPHIFTIQLWLSHGIFTLLLRRMYNPILPNLSYPSTPFPPSLLMCIKLWACFASNNELALHQIMNLLFIKKCACSASNSELAGVDRKITSQKLGLNI